MKWFFMVIIGAVSVSVGCRSGIPAKYEQQVLKIDQSVSVGQLECFDDADVWGNKWELLESQTSETNHFVDVKKSYLSKGRNVLDKKDDLIIEVRQHFDGDELISWSFSYSYEVFGSVCRGGCEYDM